MDYESESLSSSSSSSSQLSPCSPCNPTSCSSSSSQASLKSHKRKAGRKKFKETRHPIYKGVRQKNGTKWVSEVREPNKKSRIWLGTFPTPEMAARAHDVAALALRGTLAELNFPNSAWLVPRPNSSSAKDIQMAAQKAAEAFKPRDNKKEEKVLEPCLEDIQFMERKKEVVEPEITLEILCESKDNPEQPGTFFFDEEALFNMPGLLESMAEGLILTPPARQRGFDWDDLGCNLDLTLWTD
ncbi:dehydration-responsive element-binding protein 1B-like [Quercus suber]|uniref:Dehydration-responsive element-binding protein 1d n=1 Tax=Quercus suber TaxID=58331 RepID=A0AAW0LQ15_QUESU